jgi:tRNA(Ile)-lysidine synthase
MARVARDEGAERIGIGHTVDDQAETVLIAAITGSGLDAMAGIRPTNGPYVQPLIDVTRDEVDSFCRALRIRPRQDPTNRDVHLLRNAVRIRALPALSRAVGREVKVPLARTATNLREDADELARIAEEPIAELIEEIPSGVRLPVKGLLRLPRPIAARILHHAISQCRVPPTRANVQAVLGLAEGRVGRHVDLGRGSTAKRDREYLSLSRPSPESRV